MNKTSQSLRLSNIELLRLLSMFGVLTVHADFVALNEPTKAELLTMPTYSIIRTFIEAFAIVSVNVFVLISGWFGISFRWSNLLKLLFQCLFFFFGIYFTLYFLGYTQIELFKGIYKCLMLSDAWFIKSYIGMFIFAPVMNAFIEKATKKQVEVFLFAFFTFQSIYGWISNSASFIVNGYSTYSFMGLYLLARYTKIHKPYWSQWNIQKDLNMYILLSIITAASMLLFIYLDIYPLYAIFMKYSSLFTIGAAMFLLLAFTKYSLNCKFVNTVAKSCLAVYLLHFILFSQYMTLWIQNIATKYNGIVMISLIFMILLAFYIVAIFLDQIRLLLWNFIFERYLKKTV